jgi:hypothetical protein
MFSLVSASGVHLPRTRNWLKEIAAGQSVVDATLTTLRGTCAPSSCVAAPTWSPSPDPRPRPFGNLRTSTKPTEEEHLQALDVLSVDR